MTLRTAHTTIMAALEAYDLGAVSAVEPLPGLHENCPHLVTTEAGRFVAKVLAPALASPPALETRHAFVSHLVTRKLPVPRLCRSIDGRGAVLGVELYEYVPGEPCGLTEEEARAAGRLLSELHAAATDFLPSGPGVRRDWLTLDGDVARLAGLEQQARTYLPAPEVLESILAVRRRLEGAGRELARANLPRGMVHGTYEPGNLVRGTDGRLWITDFDYCHVAPLAFDLATACLAFGAGLAPAVQRGYGADLPEAVRLRVAVHLGLERGAGPQHLTPE